MFQAGAKICRASYLALKVEGFTEDQAVLIVAGGGMNTNKK